MAALAVETGKNEDWKKGDRDAPYGHRLSPVSKYIGFELETVTPTCIQGHFKVSERSAQVWTLFLFQCVIKTILGLCSSLSLFQDMRVITNDDAHWTDEYTQAQDCNVKPHDKTNTYGVLHGGISALIAESLASFAAFVASGFQQVAGVELSISHLQPASLGLEIEVKTTSIHIGRRLHVWEVKFISVAGSPNGLPKRESSKTSEPGLIAVSKLTVTVLPSNPAAKSQGDKRIPSKL